MQCQQQSLIVHQSAETLISHILLELKQVVNYIDDWFKVLCDNSTGYPTIVLNHGNLNFRLLNISVAGTVQVTNNFTSASCTDQNTTRQPLNLSGSPFIYSKKNSFTVIGCGGITWMTLFNGTRVAGCVATCDGSDLGLFDTLVDCNGINCCQTKIPPDLTAFNYSYQAIDTTISGTDCKQAFLIDSDFEVPIALSGMEHFYIPMVLDWKLSHYSALQIHGTANWANDSAITCTDGGRSCVCSEGFHGNPYIVNGCQDINECEDPDIHNGCVMSGGTCINYHPPDGLYGCLYTEPVQPKPLPPAKLATIVVGSVLGALLILICAWRLHNVMKKRKNKKRKQKFFKQNGGLLLEKQSSGNINMEKIRLFSSEELEKATDNYNANRILGQGGHGTVYKGMLIDGSIVAIKKSKIVDEGEVEQFINEIVILSQTIHRNVVKLMGCCLETEVPVLVYEFILNGSLSQYIHQQSEEFPLTWGMRLQASIEVAGALAYLHSGTSFPIYHRDIKSSNILLDDRFRAKVADFGTSRTVAIDKTHLTMSQFQGTFGYLDPEYFQSSQFTDKSDVYSFGVVLVELLTGQKPVSQSGPDEWRNLSSYFLLSMEESRLFEILDARVSNEGGEEDIMAVAQLARRCLNIKGKKRPTMKEVAVELERISQSSAKGSDVHTNSAEAEYVLHRRHFGSSSAQYNTMSISNGSPSDRNHSCLFVDTV